MFEEDDEYTWECPLECNYELPDFFVDEEEAWEDFERHLTEWHN